MKRNKRKLKLLNFFNKSRKKEFWKKRRIFTSAVLAGNLLFGNLKPNDVKTQKYLNATPVTQVKLFKLEMVQSLNFNKRFLRQAQLIWMK